MSDVLANSEQKPKTRRPRPKTDELDDFRAWLAGLEMNNPTLHVNGASYTTAVVTVDFGTPLEEQKPTPEQTAELVNRLRSATKLIYGGKDAAIRIQNDSNNGIWWSSVG